MDKLVRRNAKEGYLDGRGVVEGAEAKPRHNSKIQYQQYYVKLSYFGIRHLLKNYLAKEIRSVEVRLGKVYRVP